MLPVLSLSVYHAGARGAGLLFAAMAVGGTISVLTAGWIERARRLGRIVIVVVVVWGIAIAGLGLARTLVPAMLLLAVAGFADGISAVCRSTINQTVTPDGLRGRMSAVYNLVVTGGPRLGDVESGPRRRADHRHHLGADRRPGLHPRRGGGSEPVPGAGPLRRPPDKNTEAENPT